MLLTAAATAPGLGAERALAKGVGIANRERQTPEASPPTFEYGDAHGLPR
jgi:hypothetical protein